MERADDHAVLEVRVAGAPGDSRAAGIVPGGDSAEESRSGDVDAKAAEEDSDPQTGTAHGRDGNPSREPLGELVA
jgi:hypothetical protein